MRGNASRPEQALNPDRP